MSLACSAIKVRLASVLRPTFLLLLPSWLLNFLDLCPATRALSRSSWLTCSPHSTPLLLLAVILPSLHDVQFALITAPPPLVVRGPLSASFPRLLVARGSSLFLHREFLLTVFLVHRLLVCRLCSVVVEVQVTIEDLLGEVPPVVLKGSSTREVPSSANESELGYGLVPNGACCNVCLHYSSLKSVGLFSAQGDAFSDLRHLIPSC